MENNESVKRDLVGRKRVCLFVCLFVCFFHPPADGEK